MLEMISALTKNFKRNPFIIVLLTIMSCFLFFLWIQVFNHIPTEIKEVKEEVKEVRQEVKEVRQEVKEVNKRLDKIYEILYELLSENKKTKR